MSVQFGHVEFNDQHTAATIAIDKKVYSKSAVLRACYWFGRDLYFHLNETDELLAVTVGLRVSSPTLDQPNVRKIDEWLPDIYDALLDSQLRVEIQAETAGVRELIIAKAFAESGVLEDPPPGTFEDPVAQSGAKPGDLISISTNKSGE
jgi:His-Xaa-Ser system protein HxsD